MAQSKLHNTAIVCLHPAPAVLFGLVISATLTSGLPPLYLSLVAQ